LVTNTIEPQTWEDVGGPGVVYEHGSALVISQTRAVHEKVAELFDALREKRRERAALAIEARWLLLDSDGLRELVPDRPRVEAAAPWPVDPAALERLTGEVPGMCGRITCLDDQQVFLVAGTRRSSLHGAIPVIGSGVGYQPVVAVLNVGALLHVRPVLEPGTSRALLDVRSTVTEWDEPGPTAHIGGYSPPYEDTSIETETVHQPASSASTEIDRVNVPAQELAATVRVPLGQPTLVGGLTYLPSPEQDDEPSNDVDPPQLYLVVRVDRAEPEGD
jgi:hypothetical protein